MQSKVVTLVKWMLFVCIWCLVTGMVWAPLTLFSLLWEGRFHPIEALLLTVLITLPPIIQLKVKEHRTAKILRGCGALLISQRAGATTKRDALLQKEFPLLLDDDTPASLQTLLVAIAAGEEAEEVLSARRKRLSRAVANLERFQQEAEENVQLPDRAELLRHVSGAIGKLRAEIDELNQQQAIAREEGRPATVVAAAEPVALPLVQPQR